VRDDRSYLALFKIHRAALVSYASGIVGDHSRAEDIVQEAYIRFDAATRERLLDEPVGYLYRVVRNLALDGRRRQVREKRYFVPDAEVRAELTIEDRPSPEAEAVGKDEMRAMMAAMAELPERTRIALEMHRFGDCILKDIAAYLGISVGLAHSLVVDRD